MDCMYASTREVDQLSKWQGVGHFHTALHDTPASAEKTWVSPHCPTMLTSPDSHISLYKAAIPSSRRWIPVSPCVSDNGKTSGDNLVGEPQMLTNMLRRRYR